MKFKVKFVVLIIVLLSSLVGVAYSANQFVCCDNAGVKMLATGSQCPSQYPPSSKCTIRLCSNAGGGNEWCNKLKNVSSVIVNNGAKLSKKSPPSNKTVANAQ